MPAFTIMILASLLLPVVAQAQGWSTIKSETFEGTFPNTWTVWDGNGASYGEYFWGVDHFKPHAGTYSAWCSRSGANGKDPDGGTYVYGTASYMQYGPFSLVGVAAADITFWVWSEAYYNDYLEYSVKVGSTTYTTRVYGSSAGWRQITIDLSNVNGNNLLGNSAVYFILDFIGSVNVYQGVFIDDVLIRKFVESTNKPTIVRAPTSLTFTAPAGSAATSQTLSISNSGGVGSILRYTLSEVGGATWLTETPATGTVTTETDSITIGASCVGLSAGTYTETIRITDANATNSPQSVPVTLNCTGPCVLTVTPDSGTVNDGNTLQMTATGSGGCSGNLTTASTWAVTAGSCTVGASTGLVTAPEGCAAASCTIRATYTTVNDTTVLNVANNETTPVTTLIGGLPASAVEGAAVNYTVIRTFADGCTQDMKAGATCSGGCTGTTGSGICTMSQAPCGAAPAACMVTDSDATNSPQSVSGTNNDTISSTLIGGVPASAVEGAAFAYTVIRTWSDSCTEDMKAGATCSGGCTGTTGSGSCTMSQAPCGAAPAACVVSDSDATNSPQSASGTNNDTISSTLIGGLPGSAVEGAMLAFSVTRTWSDSCTEDLTVGSTCSGGCAGSNGICTISQASCGAAPAACVVTDSDAGNSPQSVTGTNDDSISSTLIGGLPASASEGAVLAFAVTRTWSDSCTEDMTVGSGCSGGCAGSDGLCTVSQAPCGAAPATCVVSDSDATNSPQSATGINDDTVFSTLITGLPPLAADGQAIPFAVTRTWSDTCTDDLSAGSSCSGGCAGGNGICTIVAPCGSAPVACSVADADATNNPQAVSATNGDADLDGHGSGCVAGLDCNDSDTNNWSACASCLDSDSDTWWAGCDRYQTISGPDCAPFDPLQWQNCGMCQDMDGDGYGLSCAPGPDCNDGNINVWDTCLTCVDADVDGWYVGCNQYVSLSGPDCDDANINAWDTCLTCVDADTDSHYAGCNQYVSFGLDCDDTDINVWDTCLTCADADGDDRYADCNQYITLDGPDCDDVNPYAWTACATCNDDDSDSWYESCDRYQLSPTGNVTIGTGTSGSNYPFSAYADTRLQVIYLASEIGPAGLITAIALDVSTIPAADLRNFTIRMKHTALSAYATSSWEGPGSGWTTVYRNDVPRGVPGWRTFTLSLPFNYNGTSNLMVDFTFDNSTDPGSSGGTRYTTSAANRILYAGVSNTSGAPTNWTGTSSPTPNATTSVPNLRVTMNPGGIKGPDCDDTNYFAWVSCATCVDEDDDNWYQQCDQYTPTIGFATLTTTIPFRTYEADSRSQIIYLASEIKEAGNITSIALNVSSLPGGVMNNFTIRMKHTSLSLYATNSWEGPTSGWTTVYTANEPRGITGWRIFNLTTPFNYNGTDNLLVDISHNNSTGYSVYGYVYATNTGVNRAIFYDTNNSYGNPLNWTGTTSPSPYVTTSVPDIRINIDGVSAFGPDCNDNNTNAWDTCPTCVDADADNYYQLCNRYLTVSGPDCDENSVTGPVCNAGCGTYYLDADADAYGSTTSRVACILPAGYAANNTDCSDANTNAWNTCTTCNDSDSDTWYELCNRYLTVSGPDCDDLATTGGGCHDSCANFYQDSDTDLHGNPSVSLSRCTSPTGYVSDNTDCSDTNTNAWSTCATCLDSDADSWYLGCDRYQTISGPDCNNTNTFTWNTCSTCNDDDADSWFEACNRYIQTSSFNIGTGTGTTYTLPLSTGYHDARTQTIYLSSQLGTAKRLSGLALNVSVAPGQAMSNFTIRMKHTTLVTYSTALFEGPDSGWTTVYQADETISATGWHNFNFSTPFDYNGTNNIMIDISFNNSSYTTNGTVVYSSSGNQTVFARNNSTNGDPLTWTGTTAGPAISSAYPNIRVTYDLANTINGPDCNDLNNNVWDSCATCNDDDNDSYFELCNAYNGISGPDCDDVPETGGICHDGCADYFPDLDNDSYGDPYDGRAGCLPPVDYVTNDGDCDDTDLNAWDSCATCNDDDADSWYELCNTYVGISGPDCNDLDAGHWDDCGVCVDGDGDRRGVSCDLGSDCSDANPYVWTACATCQDNDSDTRYQTCDQYQLAPTANNVTGAGINSTNIPLNTYYDDARIQVIYLASEIGPAGQITSIALDVTTIPGTVMSNFTIRMKHTGLSAYATNSWEGQTSGWVTVYQNNEPRGETGWRTFTLTTPFNFNGTNNLMVDFSFNNSGATYSNGASRYTDSGANRTLYYNTSSGYGDPLTWTGTSNPTPSVITYVPNLRVNLRPGGINGPDCDDNNLYTWDTCPTCFDNDADHLYGLCNQYSAATGAGTGTITNPLNTYYSENRAQIIYPASEIGPAGNITAVALDVSTIPAAMTLFTIRIKHTSLSAYAINSWEGAASGWTTVYQANELRGTTGWRTFILTTPFVYNGTDNLMIDFTLNNVSSAWVNGYVRGTNSGVNRMLYYNTSSYGDPLGWTGTSSPTPTASTYTPNLRVTLDGISVFGLDCDDNNANAWDTCATCVDQDADSWYKLCNRYLTVNGPDCDDLVDTGVGCNASCTTYYADNDADLYGNSASSRVACVAPAGYVSNNTDCSDTNTNTWSTCSTCNDDDADSWYELCNRYQTVSGPDCDDLASTGGSCHNACMSFYQDSDTDLHGNPSVSLSRCVSPTGYVSDNTDCADTNTNAWSTCATCNDDDLDTRFELCDRYQTVIGPDCNDTDTKTWDTCSTCNDDDADTWFETCNRYLSSVSVGAGAVSWNCPFGVIDHDRRTQVIYLSSEVGPAGRITQIALDVTSNPAISLNNFTIRMKHTTMSSYATAAWEGPDSGWTYVYQGNETSWKLGWRTFVFLAPFDYNGTDNLLIDFSFNNSSWNSGGSSRSTTVATTRSLYYSTDSGYGDPLVWAGTSNPAPNPSTNIPNIRFFGISPLINGPDCDDNAATGAACHDTCSAFYADQDADAYGDPASSSNRCAIPSGYVADNTDCAPTVAAVHPGQPSPEGPGALCDTLDNQCPGETGYGEIDEGCGPPDTDGDGLDDGTEVIVGSDPNDPDTDDDGLTDGFEYNTLGTDHLSWDSDGDHIPDGAEYSNSSGHPAGQNLDPLFYPDGDLDFDGDGIINRHDFWNAGGGAGGLGSGVSGNGIWIADLDGFPACGYWGEGDGDGFISPTDVAVISLAMKGSSNYSAVYPPNGETQDMDADTFLSPSDKSLLSQMIKGQALPVLGSRPEIINRVVPGDGQQVNAAVGETVGITLSVTNTAAISSSGIPIVFSIDPASTGGAVLLGGEAEDNPGSRYDLSSERATNGHASIWLRLTAPGTVVINAKINQCGADGLGRYCDQVDLGEPVTINISP